VRERLVTRPCPLRACAVNAVCEFAGVQLFFAFHLNKSVHFSTDPNYLLVIGEMVFFLSDIYIV
jgi:hypothetical protein